MDVSPSAAGCWIVERTAGLLAAGADPRAFAAPAPRSPPYYAILAGRRYSATIWWNVVMERRVNARTARIDLRLVLWDIDGTLVRGGRTAVEAYNRALASVYQLQEEVARISTVGKTDAQIAIETLALHGMPPDAVLRRLESFRDAYAREVESARERVAAELTVLPGVRVVLARLRDLGVAQTLLTGNFEATARVKVEAAGLAEYFDFAIGAYGSDHHDRNCLVPIVLDRARARLGADLSPEQTVVVGDTPRDVACARAGGARVVAVATGFPTVEELLASSPDALLVDLSDADAAVAAILGKE
jgi:phosphoglycolate phosphatase-like HAD superfamily hydrolase